MHRPSVIAVENELALQAILNEALGAEGYSVKTARNIANFRRIDGALQADLYIIDRNLPDGSGLALVKELRQRPSCGIIMLSQTNNEADHILGLELGADDFIVKPFRTRELVARVGAVLRRSARAVQTEPEGRTHVDYCFDGYRVSCSARQVLSPKGENISLTTAEFDLLAALLRNRGKVCDRDQILAFMKGRSWSASDRTVDGLVSRLRRKLPVEGAKGQAYIRTVHGVGYAFARQI
jgi:two-component system torCAD operon response regulator TorR